MILFHSMKKAEEYGERRKGGNLMGGGGEEEGRGLEKQFINKWTADSRFQEQINSTDIDLARNSSAEGSIFLAILQAKSLSFGIGSVRHQTSR